MNLTSARTRFAKKPTRIERCWVCEELLEEDESQVCVFCEEGQCFACGMVGPRDENGFCSCRDLPTVVGVGHFALGTYSPRYDYTKATPTYTPVKEVLWTRKS